MSTRVILVIDDSATIRKMVDGHLSQEGYRVLLAPTAERGFELACEVKPDLILLDHQLPGTTGIEVCRKIIAVPECRNIPFVISSTLRKQAYIEYMDVPNVVDSLPKPFKPELLKMAVANALETAAMVMASQTNGTAVPEVVGATDQPAFSGDFRWLGLREVIDFLNNGRKDGMLEVETAKDRVCFFLQDGRIQGVVSASFDPTQIASQLPESLKELSPLLQFTMSSGTSTQIDGLVELLDKKVLDPRILRALLRHQAAVLTRYCFLNNPVSFSFLPERIPPALFRKAPIESCLAAILIDGAMHCPPSEPRGKACDKGWVRNTLRGQNLDRTGLSAKHAQILAQLDSSPKSDSELAAKAGLTTDEARFVLEGLLLAEWVENKTLTLTRTLLAFESDVENAEVIRSMIENGSTGWTGQVLRDDLSFQLLLKRKPPQTVLVALQGESELDLPPKLDRNRLLNGDWSIVLIAPAEPAPPIAASLAALPVIRRPCSTASLARALAVPTMTAGKIRPAEQVRSTIDTVPFLEPAGAH
jgi:CheY-like chemotaxis protein